MADPSVSPAVPLRHSHLVKRCDLCAFSCCRDARMSSASSCDESRGPSTSNTDLPVSEKAPSIATADKGESDAYLPASVLVLPSILAN